MKFFRYAFAIFLSLSASPAMALPDNATELHQIIQNRFGGDANSWVNRRRNDFERIGCRDRADLFQQLLDDGLELTDVDHYTLNKFFECALERGNEQVMALAVNSEVLAYIEPYNDFGPPLLYAIAGDNYSNTLVLLQNGASRWDHRRLAVRNYTREGHLLMAAAHAHDRNRTEFLRAFEAAGLGWIVADALNREFVRYVVETGFEGNTLGGGFLSAMSDVAVAALMVSGSSSDMLAAYVGTAVINRDEGDGGNAGNLALRQELQRKMSLYLNNVEAPMEKNPSQEEETGEASSQTLNMIEELERLVDLKDRGIISDEQFEILRDQVLEGP